MSMAVDVQNSLESKFADSVVESFAMRARMGVDRIEVDDQVRHKDRMASCSATLFGEGWIGSLTLMFPDAASEPMAREVLARDDADRLRGVDVAEGMAELVGAIGVSFSDAFAEESSLTIGPPTLIVGDRLAVAFPWEQHFESRLCFRSATTDFWALLRLSHTRARL